MWDDSEGNGLGGKQYGAVVAKHWGNVCSVASTESGYSWAIGTTYVGAVPSADTHSPRAQSVGWAHVTLCVSARACATRRALVLLLPVQLAVDGELAIQAQEQQALAAQGGGAPKPAAPAS